LRKQADPKKLEEKAKVIAEREAAQNAKAQQRLGELVRGIYLQMKEYDLTRSRLAETQLFLLPYPLCV
jgi:hypothetical protein